MSAKEIYVVWSEDADIAQARLEKIADGNHYRVHRRDKFSIIQTEDIDNDAALVNTPESHCIVFELL